MNIPDDIALEAMTLKQLRLLREQVARVIDRKRRTDPIEKARRNMARLRTFRSGGNPQ